MSSTSISFSDLGQLAAGGRGSSLLLHAGEVIVETQAQAAKMSVDSSSFGSDMDRYLDAVAGATAIFREAVDAYLQTGPDGGSWRQAKKITEHMRTLDHMQQKLETGVRPSSPLGELVSEMIDPLTGVSRLLKEMKRQITGFAIESGFSGPGRCVPAYLVPEMEELTEEVCAAVHALVETYRPAMLWWQQPLPVDDEGGVSWYEGQADRISMQLIKKIFADDALDLETKLPLAQLAEEIDRVADLAETIDKGLRLCRAADLSLSRAGDSR
jgi:hypothetical protein